MNAEVTSVSRSARPLSQSAAAVTIITQEDIRRSGATTVPELLRNVPGLDVAQINASQWAISARGFNNALANKMLVLIDGRSVYTPLFHGVYWDNQDTMLDNIERIEIIRGPGAAVWGSNAMNGVINIITKDSKDTQGGHADGYGGSEKQGGAIRYGGKAGENTDYRVYGKYFNQDSSYREGGSNDAWELGRGGARTDWQASEKDRVSTMGEYYRGVEDLTTGLTENTAPFTRTLLEDGLITGGHLLSRWNHTYSPTSESSLQIYFDNSERESSAFDEDRYTGDIDWQHSFNLTDRNEVVWGAGYRLMADNTKGSYTVVFDPSRKVDQLYSSFLQDTYAVVPERVWLTLGSKFEINSYTGFEVQPTARVLWEINPRNSVWAAVSRAVSTPSRVDQDVLINAWSVPGSSLLRLEGNSAKTSEKLIAYEAGYRVQPHKRVTLDLAGYFNKYDDLRNLTFYDRFNENGYSVTRYLVDDEASGYTYGGEFEAKIQITDRLRVDTGYSYLQMVLYGGGHALNTVESQETQSPAHQFFVRPSLDLPFNIQLDTPLRYVDALKSSHVPAYFEMDVRLAWRPIPRLELSVVGQNLFHNHHLEFSSGPRPEIQRSVYGKAAVDF